jgi:hypothetical protein
MAAYRAYFLGPDNRIVGVHELVCCDDDEALNKARSLVDDKPIELWDGTRRIARIDPVRKAA